jgi:hypothetical protein
VPLASALLKETSYLQVVSPKSLECIFYYGNYPERLVAWSHAPTTSRNVGFMAGASDLAAEERRGRQSIGHRRRLRGEGGEG